MRERETDCGEGKVGRVRKRERGRDRDRIPSRLLAVHAEPDVGLNHVTLRSCSEQKSRATR